MARLRDFEPAIRTACCRLRSSYRWLARHPRLELRARASSARDDTDDSVIADFDVQPRGEILERDRFIGPQHPHDRRLGGHARAFDKVIADLLTERPLCARRITTPCHDRPRRSGCRSGRRRRHRIGCCAARSRHTDRQRGNKSRCTNVHGQASSLHQRQVRLTVKVAARLDPIVLGSIGPFDSSHGVCLRVVLALHYLATVEVCTAC